MDLKKLNNKGFAISTVIYGLSIMAMLLMTIVMATMSSNRTNSSDLAKSIEKDLNRFSKSDVSYGQAVSSSTNEPTPQQFIVEEGQDGWYRIELWGSQGGGSNGGYGAYTSGIIELNAGDVLYFYVGKHELTADVRILSGNYHDLTSYETRIMVAAGGGSGSGAMGGTLYGYQSSMIAPGGRIDVSGDNPTFNLLSATLYGYSSLALSSLNVSSGVISPPCRMLTATGVCANSGGGDGYYASDDSSIGGTSFISGYGGVIPIIANQKANYSISVQALYNSSYVYKEKTFNEATQTFSYAGGTNPDVGTLYYFVDGIMIPGVNRGDGKAKIEKVMSKTDTVTSLPRKNSTFNYRISAVRDCVDSSSSTAVRFSVMSEGKDYASPATITASGQCRTVNLFGSSANGQYVDEISIWHGNMDVKGNTIEVYACTNPLLTSCGHWEWIKVKDSPSGVASETETVTGTRISAYRYDSTKDLPEVGVYYILPVLEENKVISAAESVTYETNPLTIDYFDGSNRQRWMIELITDTNISPDSNGKEYKIVEQSRYKALRIQEDENIVKNFITADMIFNSFSRIDSQIWKITPVGDGTYTITSVVDPFDASRPSGNLAVQTNSGADSYENVIIGRNNQNTQRYRLIPADYSSS